MTNFILQTISGDEGVQTECGKSSGEHGVGTSVIIPIH